VDGVHFTIRLEEERLCTLVVMARGPTAPRKSSRSRTAIARARRAGARCCGISSAAGCGPLVLTVGDGALGFWAALRDVWPETAEQRCWVHRIANVLDKLPRSLQLRAKQALHAIMYAETRAAAEREIARFTAAYQAKYPKAVASLTVDQDRLRAYFDYPAEHWKHLRTTNPIESTFAPQCGCAKA
jgi:putative transposase